MRYDLCISIGLVFKRWFPLFLAIILVDIKNFKLPVLNLYAGFLIVSICYSVLASFVIKDPNFAIKDPHVLVPFPCSNLVFCLLSV